MATTNYCTQDDLADRLSAIGVIDRIDDLPPSALGNVIHRASVKIDQYCRLLYTPSQLAVSDWVRQVCADIATHLVCRRRGNPSAFQEEYEEAMTDLERVRLGVLQIPDIASRREAVPAMSNVRIRLDPFPRTVVERRRSAGPAVEDYQQHYDGLEFFWYGSGI